MRKIILNKCYGGFELSRKAYELYAKKKGLELYTYTNTIENNKCKYKYSDGSDFLITCFTKDFGNNVEISEEDYEKYVLYLRETAREDKTLIEVVEELGKEASGMCGKLKIVKIPDNAFFIIDSYDGLETLYYSKSEILEK